jgi:ferritin-like metal-binding protein YciE
LYSDALKQAALMKRFENHIKDKHDQIKKLKANI